MMRGFLCLLVSLLFVAPSSGALRYYWSFENAVGTDPIPSQVSCAEGATAANLNFVGSTTPTTGPSQAGYGTAGYFSSTLGSFETDPLGIISSEQAPENEGQVSFNAWVYKSSSDTTSSYVMIFNKEDSAGTDQIRQYFIRRAPPGLISSCYLYIRTSTGLVSAPCFNIIESSDVMDTWFMFTVTYDPNDALRMYINGAQVASGTATGGLYLDDGTAPYFVGKYYSGCCSGSASRVDELMYFDHALSLSEITELYNRGQSLFIPDFEIHAVATGPTNVTSTGGLPVFTVPYQNQTQFEVVPTTSFPDGLSVSYDWQALTEECADPTEGVALSTSIQPETGVLVNSPGDYQVSVSVTVGFVCARQTMLIDVPDVEPYFTSEPNPTEEFTIGELVSLSVSADGIPPPIVQWQELDVNATARARERQQAYVEPWELEAHWAFQRGSNCTGNCTNTTNPGNSTGDDGPSWSNLEGENSPSYVFTVSEADDGRVVRALIYNVNGARSETQGTTILAVPKKSDPEDNTERFIGAGAGGGFLLLLFCIVCVCIPCCLCICLVIIAGMMGSLFVTWRRSKSVRNELATRDAVWEIDYDELEIESELGSGAFGTVYKGNFRECEVAIKQLNAALADRKQFKSEANLMKGMRAHLNVIRLYGVCTHPDTPLCLVTEYMPGGDLLHWLRANGTPEPSLLYRMALDIAAGMVHLMKEGVIHRDLAARNLLLTSDMTIKVADFGMSKQVADHNNPTVLDDSRVGPLKWMSPECLEKRKFSEKSDVYAYGITLYEIYAGGRSPYPGMKPVDVALAVVNEGLQPEVPEEVHPALAQIMTRCFSRNPADRPTFRQIHSDIKTQLGDEIPDRSAMMSTMRMGSHGTMHSGAGQNSFEMSSQYSHPPSAGAW